jgi:hypothetical protein
MIFSSIARPGKSISSTSKVVLTPLCGNSLFVKRSMCSFNAPYIAYLGHIISANDVAMDNDKVTAVVSWPQPRSARGLHGFLGLARYYRKYIKDFRSIAAPLTGLLKKDAYQWGPNADEALQALKYALSTALVLQLPAFDVPFIVDCDVSRTGFGAVLHQGADVIAFFSRPFAPRHLKLAAYERELYRPSTGCPSLAPIPLG